MLPFSPSLILYLVGSSLSTSHIRFDSEDEAAEGQEEDCLMKNITDNFDSTRPYPIITPECTSEQDGEASSKKAVELQVTAISKIVLILGKMSL